MPSLIGVWRLVSVQTWNEAGHLLHRAEGDDVIGVARFTASGRMIATVLRLGPDDGGPRFVAYHGAYTVEGKTLTTRVEGALDPAWIGTDQIRETRFDGDDRIFLRPPLRPFGNQRVRIELEWVLSIEAETASG